MKKNKTYSISILFFAFISYAAGAQEIKVGGRCPDILLGRMLNEGGPVQLASWVKKPLLLCFWNKDCSVAYEFLPQLNAMQEHYAKDLQVLVVSSQKEGEIKNAFASKDLIKNISLPFITGDTTFKKLFPHRTEPHLVWMDSNLLVQAITGHEQINQGNVTDFLQRRNFYLPGKQEVLDQDIYFSRTPLMVNQYPEMKNKLVSNSYLGGEREGIRSGVSAAHFDPASGNTRIKAINTPLQMLYKLVFQRLDNFHHSRIIGDGNDDDPSMGSKRYCYDLIIHDSSKSKAYQYMRQDLDRSFSLQSELKKKTIKVLVLKRTSSVDKLKSKVKDEKLIDDYVSGDQHIFKNVRLKLILEYMNLSGKLPVQIVDETGYKGGVDMVLPSDFRRFALLCEGLRKHDLELLEEEREMEVILLKVKE